MDGGSIYYSGSIPTCACLGMSAMRLIGQKRCSLKKRLKGDRRSTAEAPKSGKQQDTYRKNLLDIGVDRIEVSLCGE